MVWPVGWTWEDEMRFNPERIISVYLSKKRKIENYSPNEKIKREEKEFLDRYRLDTEKIIMNYINQSPELFNKKIPSEEIAKKISDALVKKIKEANKID